MFGASGDDATSSATSTSSDASTNDPSTTRSDSSGDSTSAITSDDDSGSETTSAEGSTGAQSCELSEQPQLDVTVQQGGTTIHPCTPIVLEGPVTPLDDLTWEVSDCGCGIFGCDQPYQLTFSLPVEVMPNAPMCARIEITGIADEAPECPLTTLRIHPSDGNVQPDVDPPIYFGAHGRTHDDPPVHPGVYVSEQSLDTCDCPETDCCSVAPGPYELGFYTGVVGDEVVWLPEGSFLSDTRGIPIAPFAPSELWDVAVLSAHAHAVCDERPHFDWIIRGRNVGG